MRGSMYKAPGPDLHFAEFLPGPVNFYQYCHDFEGL